MKYPLLVIVLSICLIISSISLVQANTGNFVIVKGDKFYLNEKTFYPYGTNYYPSYYNIPNFQIPAKDNRNQSFLSSPYYEDHTVLLEKELQDLQDIGFNSISFSLPHKNIPNGKSNLSDFLLRLKNHNLKASVFIPACDPLSVGQNVQRSFKIDECLGYIRDYSLASNDVIFSYEIAWEPSWEDYATRKNVSTLNIAWNNWIQERYLSNSYAATSWQYDDLTIPTDSQMTTEGPWILKAKAYRRFLIDYVSKHYGEVVRQIKMIDPNHLVSARTGYTAGYTSISVMTGASKVFDFVGLEGWTLPNPSDSDLNLFNGNGFAVEYAKAVSGGKPVLFYEFGTDTLSDACHAKDRYFDQSCYKDNSVEKMNLQSSYYRHFLDMAIKSGASGSMNWMYVGKRPFKNFAYGDTEVSDYGIREVPDNGSGIELGNAKPAYDLVKQYVSLFTQNRNDTAHNGSIALDPDSFTSEADFWKKGGTDFASALLNNQFPNYVSPGSDTNSLNTPMTCVGNTPYNQACPLKYINAQFNYIEIQNSKGEWQNVTDGSDVDVAINMPILGRASIKNTGESLWFAKTNDQKGKVQIGGNENIGEVNFRANIPIDANSNNDVTIENFVISSGISSNKKVVFQMSSNMIAWFGERVEVKFIPVVSKIIPSLPPIILNSEVIPTDSEVTPHQIEKPTTSRMRLFSMANISKEKVSITFFIGLIILLVSTAILIIKRKQRKNSLNQRVNSIKVTTAESLINPIDISINEKEFENEEQ